MEISWCCCLQCPKLCQCALGMKIKFLQNFPIIADLFCTLVGVGNLMWTHNGVLSATWSAAADHLEDIWRKQGRYWIQLCKSFLQPLHIWKAYESQNLIKTLDLLYLFIILKQKMFTAICFLGFKHTDWYLNLTS